MSSMTGKVAANGKVHLEAIKVQIKNLEGGNDGLG
jgi:hypothetical protein